jgi:hypothetical protein
MASDICKIHADPKFNQPKTGLFTFKHMNDLHPLFLIHL